ncbi:MAG: hypothetical protein FJ271_16380 [Planctomycetes bacterium]|nr:hypothetical protein [Planctomycetota bacterium]
MNSATGRATPRRPQVRRTIHFFRPEFERLEDRLTPATLEVPLEPVLDLFGDQFAVVQVYRNNDGLGDRVTFGIFDTGASPITYGYADQLFFDLVGQAIPTIPGATVTAEGVGGSLTGLVSQPGTILADGMHAIDLAALLDGFGGIDLSAAAAVANVQAMVGTATGSPNLPAIVGTPILNGGLGGADSGGVAVLIDMQGYQIDFGALFPEIAEYQGLILPMPDLFFVAPGTLLAQGADTTEPVRGPVHFIGIDNHLDPGSTITESYNPVVQGIQASLTTDGVTAEVHDQIFLFDTGAQLTILSTAMAQALGIDLNNPETTIDIQGAGGSTSVPGFTIDQLVLPRDDDNDGVLDGTLVFTNVPIFVLDVDPSFDGILGMNLLNTAAQFLYDPHDPDGAGPSGPSLRFTFSTLPRDAGIDTAALNALNALFPSFAGSVDGSRLPGCTQNHAPQLTVNQTAVSADEGKEVKNTGTFTDPDGDAVTISADIGTVTQTGNTWSWSLPVSDGPLGPVVVNITADDGRGGTAGASFTYSVHDVKPSITISGANSVNEGSSYSLTLGVVSDPGANTVTSYIVHWGDGSTDTYTSTGVKTHTYADGPSQRAITVDLENEDGTHVDRANSFIVTVSDISPTILLTGNDSVNRLVPYQLHLGAVIDPGSDTVAGYRVNWGDGENTGFVAGSPSGQALQHVYAQGGVVRQITVELWDEHGLHAAAGAKSMTVASTPVNLKIKTQGMPAVVSRGQRLTLALILINRGSFAASGVFAVIQLAPGMSIIPAASTPGWQHVGRGRYRLDVGSLAAGAKLRVVLKVRIASSAASGSQLAVIARIGDDGQNGRDLNPADNVLRLLSVVA